MMRSDENYCSTREAAERLDVSLRTVQLWVESGALQAWKTPGGHRRVSLASVELMLEARRSEVPVAKARPRASLSFLVVDEDIQIVRLCQESLRGMGLSFAIKHMSSFPDEAAHWAHVDVLIAGQGCLDIDRISRLQVFREQNKDWAAELIVVVGVELFVAGDMQALCKGMTVYSHPPPLNLIRSKIQQIANSKFAKSE